MKSLTQEERNLVQYTTSNHQKYPRQDGELHADEREAVSVRRNGQGRAVQRNLIDLLLALRKLGALMSLAIPSNVSSGQLSILSSEYQNIVQN